DITERKEAERQIRDHAEDLARVAETARDLAGLTDAHAARPAICKAARELAGAKTSILYEPDPKGQELVSTAVAGAQVDQIHLPFTGRPSGATTVFSSGEPLFVSDLASSSIAVQGVRRVLGVSSALWQPVVRNGVPIGVLTLAWEERVEDPGERVWSLMNLLAAEAAVAIERADLLARLEAVARTDDLTGLANRRAWDEHLPRELSRAEREERPLCVAMLDLDRFKAFNDERGHQAGDRLLKQVAATWREMLRPSDLLARYGGEEFGLVLPHCPLEVGLEVVERLRSVTVGGQTCSAGVAVWDGSESPDELVRRADAALYAAKKAGRDRAVSAA
ncbi:MAG: sensor domain-containing diguanylate cyclase, partial [Actinomycetota bacterium]|nr:sensor domain-containing diguanylate cyclase [Actinomycetota bacterium]